MFKKNSAAKKEVETPSAVSGPIVKYQNPKILLIDLDDDTKVALEKDGYNVTVGTFGRPYKVERSSNYQPVMVKPSLPNYTEREIVIVDVMPDEPTDHPQAEKSVPNEELDWWAKCSSGFIDPRPRVMAMVQSRFDLILQNGGSFIVFADGPGHQEFVYARTYPYRGLVTDHEIAFNNWSFLSILTTLDVKYDNGEEITPVQQNWPVVRFITEHLYGAPFYCTFEAPWQIEKRWVVLAKNKYGSTVAACIAPPEKSKSGWIFIFPRIANKAVFLAGFLRSILPDLSPSLFPHVEGQRWVHRPEYELPTILEKAISISAIRDEATRKVAELEAAIEKEREADKFLYDLLRETGASLVTAVEKALTILGFANIVDVDAEMKKDGKEGSLREDLRIHDSSPVLVVDVKGVAGKPADAEALQAQKHAFIYIQEQNRADVRGLTIINSQRLLPPLDRDNDMPFRKEILDNATQLKLGLMTTWDLFRLVRGFRRHSWKPDLVKPLFYSTGRILPIPRHYEYSGKVKQVWKNAFSVQIEHGTISVGDHIAIEFPVDFDEMVIASLRLNDADIRDATAGSEAGIARGEALPKVKEGFAVYRILRGQLSTLDTPPANQSMRGGTPS